MILRLIFSFIAAQFLTLGQLRSQNLLTTSVEVKHVHTVDSTSSLFAHTTLEVYVFLPDSQSKILGFYSEPNVPFNISANMPIWQHPLGSSFQWEIPSFAVDLIPELAFDSWLNLTSTNTSGLAVNNLLYCSNAFDYGGNLELFHPNDSCGLVDVGVSFLSEFVLPAGPDNKVLIGQFTIPNDAVFVGNINLYVDFGFGTVEQVPGVSFAYANNGAVPECTDFTACNYDLSTSCGTSGPCFYPTETVPCDGSCPDTNLNGICDLVELTEAHESLLELNTIIQTGGLCGDGTIWSELQQKCVFDETCPEDVNDDGHVGAADLVDLLGWYGEDCIDFQSCGLPLQYLGETYGTIEIGGQCWFSENLRTTQYSNLDTIQTNLTPTEWESTNEGACAVYGDSPFECLDSLICLAENNLQKFGRLYNAHAVNDWRGLCPTGWHVPTDEDWKVLESHLGLSDYQLDLSWQRGTTEGYHLKADSNFVTVWDGNNNTGFSAVPAGLLNPNANAGDFIGGGIGTTFWTSTSPLIAFSPALGVYIAYNASLQAVRQLSTGIGSISRVAWDKNHGASVRCIKNPL